MNTLHRTALLLGVLGFGLPLGGGAQELSVGSDPTCAGCRVILEPVMTLGSINDADGPAGEFVVTLDDAGRAFVAPLSDRASVGVYGPTGEHLQTLGRSGEGPGEFRFAAEAAILPGDSLIVVDYLLSRYTVYSPELEVMRVQRLPFPDDGSVFFSSRDLVIHASRTTRDQIGFLLHHIVDGEVVRSFAETEVVLPGGRTHLHRRIARSRDGTIWLAHENRYQVERWDTAGTRLATLRADRDWFPPSTGRPDITGPMISSVWEGENGLLFVLMNVPATSPRDEEAQEGRSNWLVAADSGTDSVIEVIDPRTGALVARHRSEDLLYAGLMDVPGLVQLRSEDEDTGWLRVTLWRVRINSYPGG